MSSMNHIGVKRIKLEDNHETLTSFGATCRNSVVDCFKYNGIKFLTKQLDDKKVRAYNTYNNTGKIVPTIF